jgi:type IV pilus assembly protein PilE
MKIPEQSLMTKQTTPPKMALSGFSLLELVVTMAIASILATIAVTAYTSQIQKSRRTDARSALLDLAGREEKLFSTNNAYSATPSDLGYAAVGTPFPISVGSGYYTVNVTVANPPVSYVITATAVGTQTSDTQCVTLSVDQTGAQTSTGTGTAATCWGN